MAEEVYHLGERKKQSSTAGGSTSRPSTPATSLSALSRVLESDCSSDSTAEQENNRLLRVVRRKSSATLNSVSNAELYDMHSSSFTFHNLTGYMFILYNIRYELSYSLSCIMTILH